MDTEREAAWRTRLNEIAPQITAGLGAGWSLKLETERPYHPEADLSGPGGAELRLRVETYGARAGRLVATGHLNGLYDHLRREDREAPRTITVSLEKTPETVTSDIKKRLLPGYLAVLRRGQANKAEQDARHAAIQQAARDLAATIGGQVVTHTRNYCDGDTVDAGPILSYVNVYGTPDKGITVHVERGFTLSLEKFLRLCAALKD